MPTSGIKKGAHAAAEEALSRLSEDVEGLRFTQVSTSDGHIVAERSSGERYNKTVAAMSSSLISLAATLSNQVGIGEIEDLLIESGNGTGLALRISDELFLVLAAKRETETRLLLSSAERAADSIRSHVT